MKENEQAKHIVRLKRVVTATGVTAIVSSGVMYASDHPLAAVGVTLVTIFGGTAVETALDRRLKRLQSPNSG